jgi:hypothetical protein
MSWKQKHRFTIGTWNVEGIGHKDKELYQVLSEKFIKIAAITEMKKKLKGIIINNYIQNYCGVGSNKTATAGIALMIHR